jgi:hypothetical protein
LVSGDHAVLCDLECGPSSLNILPPEVVLGGPDKYETPADVFAFGLLLWSMQNRNMPRMHAASHLERDGPLADVMADCLRSEADLRPTMETVVQRIEGVLAGQ